ncbi:TonB-dependent receptor [Lysobacter solisilvae (ex Woo and Kim 2020)]|uniref:TonB-dependent receptor n=1 Tax=Agrilutibacter terrestris TaxID=2865112 RepID=A0A7H0FU65_9GAMM|nr:TonB-dependent receptor [Lysobacter terrestris]QNP39581.1 TonB-dependent receptor [Lysobacter terrestris]
MVQFKRNLLSVALASATMMLAAAAQAQTAEEQPQPTQQDEAAKKEDAKTLESVTVTGIRVGIESAISTKKESTSIVESVSAEDIGKLPDVSIAESIARLPGLAAQRVAGRAQVISVRGLSPDFATTLLNGRELVSTGDNRSVEFDQYPSELMSGVTVYKTPDAGLIGQGLSGTIDMQTVRPLRFDKSVTAVSVRGQRNSLGAAADASGYGERINASYIGQFADRTIGLALGYSHSKTPIQENQVGIYEPWSTPSAGNPSTTAGMKALRRTGYVERDGVMATVEFRPSSIWTSTVDLFHSEATQEDTANQWEVNFGYNGCEPNGQCNVPLPPTVISVDVNDNNTVTGGTIANVYPLVRGMYNKREDKIDAFGWNNEFNLESVKIVADVSWSKATRDELNLENNTQLLPYKQLDTLGIDFRGDDFSQISAGLDYSDPTRLFLTNTIYGSGYGKTPNVQDELKSFKLAATFAAPAMFSSWLNDIDVGLNYADREKEKHQPEGGINLGAQGITAIAPDLQYGLVDLGFAGLGKIPSWNVPGAVARYMTFAPNENASYLVSKAWTVNEKIATAWLKGNIDTEWGSVGVRGNFGVQVQHTDQSSSANYWDNSQPAGSNVRPFEDGKKYTDVLPSMNLAFLLPADQTLRFALARQVARARVDQLRSSLEFGVNTTTGEPGGSGGNPRLDPWRANAFDVSYEKYFGNKAYVAAAYFYKDLRSYIFTQTRDGYDFSDFVAGYVPGPSEPPTLTTGRFTAPYNGKGGKLQGVELTASLPLEMVWEPLRGFGVIASASFNDSNIKVRDPESTSSVGSEEITLPGLSDEVYNLTAYFERGGFEARVSQRKRSDFIGEIGNFAGNRTLRYVVGEDIIDAQVSYSFSDESVKGLSVLFQVSNLNNSDYRTYAGSKDRPLENIEWGRTYLFGVNYKF